jgi:hypothetical protein
VFVDLGTSLTFQDGHGSQDVLSSIERVIGGNFDDLFRGGPGSNAFDGGDGFDTVDYSAATVGWCLTYDPAPLFRTAWVVRTPW